MKHLVLYFSLFFVMLSGCAQMPTSGTKLTPEQNLEAAFTEALKSLVEKDDFRTAYFTCHGANEDARKAGISIPPKLTALTKLAAQRYVDDLTTQTYHSYYKYGLVLAEEPAKKAIEIVLREEIKAPDILVTLVQKIAFHQQDLFLQYEGAPPPFYGNTMLDT